jgi:hypothetical protein
MPSDRGKSWIRSVFGRARAGQDPGSAALRARVSGSSQILRVRNPSSEVGPEPVHIGVTGCSLLVELVACGMDTVVVEGVRAEIVSVDEVTFDGVAQTMSRMPDLNLAPPDADDMLRRSVRDYRPLAPPHLEVLLDQRPPLVRPARGSTQEPVAFPVSLGPEEGLSLFVAPVTGDSRVTSWNLIVDYRAGDRRGSSIEWPQSVTGDVGFRTFSPDGTAPEPTPVSVLAPDHWTPVPETCWGDLTRYAAARRADDSAAFVDELLGLMVLLPRNGTPRAPLVSRIDGGGMLWVFTSNRRMEAVVAEQGIDSYDAQVLPFAQVLENASESEMPFGVAVDPNTDLSAQFPPSVVPALIEHRKALLADRNRSAPPR